MKKKLKLDFIPKTKNFIDSKYTKLMKNKILFKWEKIEINKKGFKFGD